MHKISRHVVVSVLSVFLISAVGWNPAPARAAKEIPMVPANFAELAETARPGVVNIRTVRTLKGGGPVFRHFFGDRFGDRRHPFEDFFGPFRNMPEREHKERSLGSGFIIDRDGYIVTNNHVIAEADEIKVKLANGDEFDAEVVGRDPKTDLALIKIKDAEDLTPLPLGDSKNIKVGTWVVAIGSPFGLEQTVTQGIVSAKGRSIGSGPYDDYIQTDASINPGNSGGPLLNLKGEVVGINTAIIDQAQNIGFAISVDVVIPLLDDLIAGNGAITPDTAFLGVSTQTLSVVAPEQLAEFGVTAEAGAFVADVVNDSSAQVVGIRPGDVIQELAGVPVTSSEDVARIVRAQQPGDTVDVVIDRGGERVELAVDLGRRGN